MEGEAGVSKAARELAEAARVVLRQLGRMGDVAYSSEDRLRAALDAHDAEQDERDRQLAQAMMPPIESLVKLAEVTSPPPEFFFDEPDHSIRYGRSGYAETQ